MNDDRNAGGDGASPRRPRGGSDFLTGLARFCAFLLAPPLRFFARGPAALAERCVAGAERLEAFAWKDLP